MQTLRTPLRTCHVRGIQSGVSEFKKQLMGDESMSLRGYRGHGAAADNLPLLSCELEVARRESCCQRCVKIPGIVLYNGE